LHVFFVLGVEQHRLGFGGGKAETFFRCPLDQVVYGRLYHTFQVRLPRSLVVYGEVIDVQRTMNIMGQAVRYAVNGQCKAKRAQNTALGDSLYQIEALGEVRAQTYLECPIGQQTL
jgi:hypothetical protein